MEFHPDFIFLAYSKNMMLMHVSEKTKKSTKKVS